MKTIVEDILVPLLATYVIGMTVFAYGKFIYNELIKK